MELKNPNISDYKNISVFQGLNSLRFIAAFLVVMHHSETIKRKNGLDDFEWLGLFRNGGNAVTFFFVLSGFLITYLLLKERGKTGNTNVKSFYLKRVLRIWPLYFLLVLIGTIGLPFAFKLLNITYEMPYTLGQTWFYFLFFLPGMVTFFFGNHFLQPLWSIGVEEVFYLIWAPLFKFTKRNLPALLIGVILIKTLLSLLGVWVLHNDLFNYIMSTFQFEAMAIGGLGAHYIYTKGHLVNDLFIFKVPLQIIILFITLFYLIFHSNVDNSIWNIIFNTPIVSHLLIDFLFLYVIIYTSCLTIRPRILQGKIFSYLGEISYGIYMYHMLVIFGTMNFLKKYLIQLSFPFNHITYYLVVAACTILIAALSKHFFENYFLRIKDRLNNTTGS